jgi:hypothetical protein
MESARKREIDGSHSEVVGERGFWESGIGANISERRVDGEQETWVRVLIEARSGIRRLFFVTPWEVYRDFKN